MKSARSSFGAIFRLLWLGREHNVWWEEENSSFDIETCIGGATELGLEGAGKIEIERHVIFGRERRLSKDRPVHCEIRMVMSRIFLDFIGGLCSNWVPTRNNCNTDPVLSVISNAGFEKGKLWEVSGWPNEIEVQSAKSCRRGENNGDREGESREVR